MTNVDLNIGAFAYDQFAGLIDGSVGIEGADVHFEHAHIVTRIFKRMILEREFDVAELGWTFFLRTFDQADSPFVAMPVFPNRQFRHGAIYVNTSTGIDSPEDLAGKTVGEFATYGHDAGFWAKGILSDEYGVTADQCRWVVGGLDWPMDPVDFIPFVHPDTVIVERRPHGTDLGALLDAGKIDALVSADVPKCMLDGSPRVRRLFSDYKERERDYYRRTGIFPIMHTIVMRRDVVDANPGLARAVYDGFCASKNATAARYRFLRIFNNMNIMIPWLSELIDENTTVLGDDYWPYGMTANRDAVETVLRYHNEQGLTKRQLTIEDVFVPELLDT